MSAKYEIFLGKDQHYYFHLKAANGQIILSSEGYNQKEKCQEGIVAVQKNSQIDERFVKKEDKAGRYFFILQNKQREVIGKSQSYISPQTREEGIQSVVKNGATEKIQTVT